MNRVFFFIIFISGVILVLGAIEILLLRQLHRDWWQRRWIRRSAYILPTMGVLFFLGFVAGEYFRHSLLSTIGAAGGAAALILEVGLMFSLPVSATITGINSLWDRLTKTGRHPRQEKIDRGRRLILKAAAAAVPAAAIGTGVIGIGRAFGPTNVYVRPIKFTGLPDDLIGLRILHLSDTHLHHYVTLDSLERILEEADDLHPDLILWTGDIADNLRLLPDALTMVAGLSPRLGAFASLGNHEHFRGIDQVLRTHEKSPVPLLVNEETELQVGATTIYLGGIDDPIRMRGANDSFFREAIGTTLNGRTGDGFPILMSHRPDALPVAAASGVSLVLAGHTHGGQIGFMGQSLLEGIFPSAYLWGEYRRDDCVLYTSAGAGHWFPFRLGCPPEAPLIELQRT